MTEIQDTKHARRVVAAAAGQVKGGSLRALQNNKNPYFKGFVKVAEVVLKEHATTRKDGIDSVDDLTRGLNRGWRDCADYLIEAIAKAYVDSMVEAGIEVPKGKVSYEKGESNKSL